MATPSLPREAPDVLDSWLSPVIEAGMGVLAVLLFALLSIACEAGYRVGHGRRGGADLSDAETGASSILTGGMLALLAFMLGLTVSFAESRYEARRDLVVEEANAIGTAGLRARMVGGAEGELIAVLIDDFAQTRLQFTRAAFASPVDRVQARAAEDQKRIWDLATAVARREPTPITASLISAINTMFDTAQSQRFAFVGRVPPGVLTLLVVGSVLAIGAMGFQLGLAGHRQPVLSSLLLAMWVGGMVLAVDLSRPRLGSMRVDTEPLEWTIQELAPPAPVGR
jgi:hypothetical protein